MLIVNQDLLTTEYPYILQQCNCLTVRSHGLSANLAAKFPHGDAYKHRRSLNGRNLAIPEDRSKPGSVDILLGTPNIICVYGQWTPGKVNNHYQYPDYSIPETNQQRLLWFTEGLEKIGNYFINNNQSVTIAIPYNIGCGLAGGNWDDYYRTLTNFENKYQSAIKLVVYKYP